MPTTTLVDPSADFKVWALQARTDDAGNAVDDFDAEDARLVLSMWSTGVVKPADGFLVAERGAGANMSVDVGSGDAETDIAVIAGGSLDAGQGNYIIRLADATVNCTITAADVSNPRIDEIYLVIQDDTYDSTSRAVGRLAVRTGDAAGSPSAPGPDTAWDAYMLLATVAVAASETAIETAHITDGRVFGSLVLGGSERIGVTDADTTMTRVVAPSGGSIQLRTSVAQMTIGDDDVNLHANNLLNVGSAGLDFDSAGATQLPIVFGSATSTSGVAMTASFVDRASDTFSRPSGWNTYSILAWGSTQFISTSNGNFEARIEIGASNGTAAIGTAFTNDASVMHASHAATGLSASSTVVTLASREDGGAGDHSSSAISYIAVRTS